MYEVNFIANAIDKVNSFKYQKFLIPYTFFALMNNKNSHVEIVVEDVEKFKAKYKNELEELNKIEKIKNNYLIRQMKFKRNKNIPNVYRFYEVPTVKAKYTYIGDVDIMILEDILDKHFLKHWPGKLPYNNILRRPNHVNITGLQMVKTDKYFTEEFVACQKRHYLKNWNGNDEFILGQMCKEIHGLPSFNYRFRPEGGVHISPNRKLCKVWFKEWENKISKLSKSYEKLFSFDCFKFITSNIKKNGDFKNLESAKYDMKMRKWLRSDGSVISSIFCIP
tara:strand:- start:212 stop:1048 length:837 start_codon:yes stop_codon:yes gene_type:complete